MKKIMFTILMILATTFVYGMEQDYSGKILIEKLKVLRMIETLKKHNEIVPTVMANVVGADETLKRVANLNEELKVDTLILVFPDVNEVKKYLSDVSKKSKKCCNNIY